MHSLNRKIVSVALSVAMIVTMLPMSMTTYAAEQDCTYTPEKIVEQGNTFYHNKNTSESGWIPMSLTQFTLKASGNETKIACDIQDNSKYIYAGKNNGKRFLKDYPSYNLLGESDQIFDLIADGTCPEILKARVENLLAKQGEDGLFTDTGVNPHALSQARIILALDAYYGADYEQQWGTIPNDSNKGRIAAVKALIKLWDSPNSRFKGDSMIASPNVMGITTGFKNADDKELTVGFPIVALSDYTDCQIVDDETGKTVGELSRTAICKGLATVEGIFSKKNDGLSNYNDFIYLTPAILSIDGMVVDADILPTMGKMKVDDSHNRVNAKNLISTYQLLNGLNSLVVYSTDGGIWTGKKNFEANAREFLTQQTVIASSDMIQGETAWKRIITPHAKSVNDVAADAKAIKIPTYTYDNLDLNKVGKYGSEINWQSSDSKSIATNGAVTAPDKGSKKVTITATITKGSATKEKTYVVVVKSNSREKAVETLEKMMTRFDTAYQKDVSSLGVEGIFALKAIERDLSKYKVAPIISTGEISVTDRAKNILHLTMTGENPYDQNGIDYVETLWQQKIGGGVECAWALLAFDAANKVYPANLLNQVEELAINSDTSLQDRSMAVCALPNHISEDGVSQALEFARTQFKNNQNNGMFGSNINDHAAVVSALVSMGEDLSLEEWIQNDQTPLTVLSSEENTNLNVMTALGDMIAEKSIYQRNTLLRSSFAEALKQAKALLDSGTDLYSENSLIILQTAYDNALLIDENQTYGKCYYNLKTAIAGLSLAQLELSDADDYTVESIQVFENAASTLQAKLSQKSVTVKELAETAKIVNEAYKNLQKLSDHNEKKIASNKQLSARTMLTTEKLSGMTETIGKRMLDKTISGYDAEYGYDVSRLGYWGVFEVCAMGKDVSKYKVYDVTTHKSGALTTYQATDFAAIILQLVMIGENPYDYNGTNYVDWLLKEDNGQGNFGPWANNIWALMALDATGADYNENLITTVINQAGSESFDIDMRGWALAAIQNHKDKISNAEMDAIIKSLRSKMKTVGDSAATAATFGNSFSQGCVITGLNAAGVDLTAGEWTVDNLNPLTALEKMQTENGKFIVGGNFDPAFVKDDVIAVGDVVQGSNVWQRTCLTKSKLDQAISDVESVLNDNTSSYSSAKVAALRSALENAKEISEIKGNGKLYFKLLEAKSNLTYIPIPTIADADTYDYSTFSPFKSAIALVSQELARGESSVSSMNSLCERVAVTYNALKKTVKPNPDSPSKPTGDITVSFSLFGDEVHGEGIVHVYAKNPASFDKWIPKTKVTVPAGSTVFDVFDAQLKKANIGYDESGAANNYVRWIKSPKSGDRIEEFTNGNLSGWMYTINGEHPLGGMNYDVLKNGDNIIWHYTDNYTMEQGADHWGEGGKVNTTPTEKNKEISTITLEAKTDTNGKAVAYISAKDMSNTLKKALEAVKTAEKEGKKEVKAEVRIDVTAVSKSSSVETTIPTSALKEVANANNIALTVVTPVGNLSFDKKALSAICMGASGEAVKVSIEEVNKSKTPLLKNLLTLSRPVYQMKVTSEDKAVTNFKDGKATISLPYTLGKDEKAANMSIYYIDDNGKMAAVKDVKYDEKAKMITFTTEHFSYYAIGYESNVKTNKFKDVNSTDWFYENVMYMLEKGILKGKEEAVFAPKSNITRAEFIQILYNMAKIQPVASGSGVTTGAVTTGVTKVAIEFRDIKATDWYAPAIAWASENLIVSGLQATDGTLTFCPNTTIRRQDMAVMIGNYTEHIEKKGLTNTNNTIVFADDAQITPYAKSAVIKMQQAGIINGINQKDMKGNSIMVVAPLNNATRAEAATMIAQLLKQ